MHLCSALLPVEIESCIAVTAAPYQLSYHLLIVFFPSSRALLDRRPLDSIAPSSGAAQTITREEMGAGAGRKGTERSGCQPSVASRQTTFRSLFP